jgi:hypothetical protein
MQRDMESVDTKQLVASSDPPLDAARTHLSESKAEDSPALPRVQEPFSSPFPGPTSLVDRCSSGEEKMGDDSNGLGDADSTSTHRSSVSPPPSVTAAAPIQPDHYYGGSGIPVFKPTYEEFHDFQAFIDKIEVFGMKYGIGK